MLARKWKSVSDYIRILSSYNTQAITAPAGPSGTKGVEGKKSWLQFRTRCLTSPVANHFGWPVLFQGEALWRKLGLTVGTPGLLSLAGIAVKYARVPVKRCLWYRSGAGGALHWYDFDVITPHMFPLLRCPVSTLLYVVLQNKPMGLWFQWLTYFSKRKIPNKGNQREKKSRFDVQCWG